VLSIDPKGESASRAALKIDPFLPLLMNPRESFPNLERVIIEVDKKDSMPYLRAFNFGNVAVVTQTKFEIGRGTQPENAREFLVIMDSLVPDQKDSSAPFFGFKDFKPDTLRITAARYREGKPYEPYQVYLDGQEHSVIGDTPKSEDETPEGEGEGEKKKSRDAAARAHFFENQQKTALEFLGFNFENVGLVETAFSAGMQSEIVSMENKLRESFVGKDSDAPLGPFVLFNTLFGSGQEGRMPEDIEDALVNQIVDSGYPIVLLGGHTLDYQKKIEALKLKIELKQKKLNPGETLVAVVDTNNVVKLAALIALTKKQGVYVGAVSGAMHLSEIFGAPTVVFRDAATEKNVAPYLKSDPAQRHHFYPVDSRFNISEVSRQIAELVTEQGAFNRSEVRSQAADDDFLGYVENIREALRDKESIQNFEPVQPEVMINMPGRRISAHLGVNEVLQRKKETRSPKLGDSAVIDVGGDQFVLIKAAAVPDAIVATTGLLSCSGVGVKAVKDGEVYYGAAHIFHGGVGENATMEDDILFLSEKMDENGFAQDDIEWFLLYKPESYGVNYDATNIEAAKIEVRKMEDSLMEKLGTRKIQFYPKWEDRGVRGETLIVDQEGFLMAGGIFSEQPFGFGWLDPIVKSAVVAADEIQAAEPAVELVQPEVIVTSTQKPLPAAEAEVRSLPTGGTTGPSLTTAAEVVAAVAKKAAAVLSPEVYHLEVSPVSEQEGIVLVRVYREGAEGLETLLMSQMDVIEFETKSKFQRVLAAIRGTLQRNYAVALQVPAGLDEGVLTNFMRGYLRALTGRANELLTQGVKGAQIESVRSAGLKPRVVRLSNVPVYQGDEQSEVPLGALDQEGIKNLNAGYSPIVLDLLTALANSETQVLLQDASNAENLGELIAT
ncbi:MAG: hypothetical protein KBC91_08475, partial [Candidatus Omnitrophica bacterium]|nr:hypothetical protein [Candidatus Omnitrophota bacterium]